MSVIMGMEICTPRYLLVANPQAASFRAADFASEFKDHFDPGVVDVYETAEDPDQRLRDISGRLRALNPSRENPVRVISLGGDRTVNDAVQGVLLTLFPNLFDPYASLPSSITDRMAQSGIQMAALSFGGASDIPINHGLQASSVEDVRNQLDQAISVPLNMGRAAFDRETSPSFFVHSVSAGETVATVYEATQNERGNWARRHRQWLGARNFAFPHPICVRWSNPEGGQRGEAKIFEVVAHAVPRVDKKNGLPGTPQPGLGLKVLSYGNFWKTLQIALEMRDLGKRSLRGDPTGLMPEDRLEHLDPYFQIALAVGQEMTFSFFDASFRGAQATAVQGNGDFIRRSPQITITALPPAQMLATPNSLMAQVHSRHIF